MSNMSFVGRIGRDTELRFTPNGDPVCNIAVAYNYGRKGQDGKKPSQWVDAAIFGKRAEALTPYLVKGQQVFIVLNDAHIRTYQKNDGTQGFSLSGSVSDIQLVGNAPQQAAAPAPAPRQARSPAPQMADDDFDDLPF